MQNGQQARRRRREIDTPRGRFLSQLHFQFLDHALLRHGWTNLDEIAPGVWRSNQPDPRRLARYKEMGIRTILSLRGTPDAPHYLIEKEACKNLGLTFVTAGLNARQPPKRAALLTLLDHFHCIERPFVMHCKSGADRAGLASVLYLMVMEDAPLEEARRQLSFRYLHIRQSRTGILDRMLDMYEERLKRGPVSIADWIAAEYDPEALGSFDKAKR